VLVDALEQRAGPDPTLELQRLGEGPHRADRAQLRVRVQDHIDVLPPLALDPVDAHPQASVWQLSEGGGPVQRYQLAAA
jgi:hypothetical protein